MDMVWNFLVLVWFHSWQTQAQILERNGYTYKIMRTRDDRRTFYEAEEICQQREGGHLVSIMKESQNAWLNRKIRLVLQSNEVERFWVGANDKKMRGVFQWLDGEHFVFSKAMWASERPIHKKHEYERCLFLRSSPTNAIWSSEDCYQSMGYICKIKGYPTRITERTRFGYEFDYGKYIYKVIFLPYDMLSWPEAEIYCKTVESGHLMSVENPGENRHLQHSIQEVRKLFGFRRLWIGASDFYDEGRFAWSDGTPMNFTKWAVNQPSGMSRGQDRDCTTVAIKKTVALWYDEECPMELPFICKIKMCDVRVEIGFVIDSSGSVRGPEFRQAKRFIKTMISKFEVTPKKSHVGFIRYSTNAEVMFRLDQHLSLERLYQAVDKIAHIGGGTRTDLALRTARENLFTEQAGARPFVSKVMILLTDGVSENPKQVVKEARKLKMSGVLVLAVGIGRNVNRKELKTIATSRDDVFNVKSYRYLMEKVSDIRERVCM